MILLTEAHIVTLRSLISQATPIEDLPNPYDEPRTYSDKECQRLEADKNLRKVLDQILGETHEPNFS